VSPQLPLALTFRADQLFSAYVGQDALRSAVEATATGDTEEWLYLAGATGSGKTHLLLAACAEARRQGRRALYAPLAALAGRLPEALADQEANDLICIDGIERIVGTLDDEVALFHFHNGARAAGTRLIYAANAMPAALAFRLPDLASRLEQCTRLALEPLDEAGRRAVLRERAARRGLELDDAVLDYLFRHVDRDLATLTALLDRLDRESLAAQRRITVPFLRSVVDVARVRA